MNDENRHSKELLKAALEEEKIQFEKFYLWLENSMPSLFFKEVPPEWISLIVHALVGFRLEGWFSEIHFKNAAISLCIENPEADVRILSGYSMYGIKNYTTYISRTPLPFSDVTHHLRIAIIKFTEITGQNEEPLSSNLKKELQDFLQKRHPTWGEKKCQQLIEAQDPLFLRKMPLDRQGLAIELFERAESRDLCQYEVQYEENWQEKELPSMHLIVAWKNTPKHNFLYRLARVVHRHNLVMRRVVATYLHPYKTNSVLMLSFGLHGNSGEAAFQAADIADFLQEFATLKYFGTLDLIDQTFVAPKLISGNLGNFLRSTVDFVHQILVNVDPHLYTIDNITEGLCAHPELTVKLCEAFEQKFHPIKNNIHQFEESKSAFTTLVLHLDTGHEGQDNRRRNVLLQAMNFVSHILKCNFYRNNKSSLSFRLDPRYLNHTPFEREKLFPELPFAIFYIKGMHFISFHIRFKDLARGGLRTIYTAKKEKMLAERNTVFIECYNLAYTQQKKNKDIPEGGAKGVIFLKPFERLSAESDILLQELNNTEMEKEEIEKYLERFKQEQILEYLYQTQRSFIESFLTIINCNDDGTLKAKHIIDYYKQPEYIYLGPDENMHDSMIEWIAAKSISVGYRPKGSFISGKPSCGINHKEYGVTSWGLNVYMHEILKSMGIDPLQDPFTVKITGGPDGDVAGNQIHNLYRFYPNTAKLLALTDVSGTIYDPEGLNLKTMNDLFKKGQPIRFYPPELLNSGGFLLNREKKREPSPYVQQTLCWHNKEGKLIEEWLSGSEMNALFRNNVHRTQADIFLPCGGRPRTLHDTNYKEFLDSEGKPTARAIVEGANLYLSPWARSHLEQLGVLIVKDSSANKGGVTCSSFEILAGLTLTESQFLEHKQSLVQEILDRLKQLSLDEATLLLETRKITHEFLTQISDDISKRINFFTDQLLEYLDTITLSSDVKDPLIRCFLHYCPKILRQHFEKELIANIPENHKKAIIASHIASRLVYKRGLKWFPSLVDILPLLLQQKDILY